MSVGVDDADRRVNPRILDSTTKRPSIIRIVLDKVRG